MTTLNIFLNTWGNYNENGADGGEWVRLPHDDIEAEMDRIAAAMGDDDPEWAIHDYEWTGIDLFDISEYSNIVELNNQMREFEDLNEWEQKEVAALMEAGYYSNFVEAMNSIGTHSFYADTTIEDLAYELAEDYLHNAPEFLSRYFDYDAFARDLGFDYTETTYGVLGY